MNVTAKVVSFTQDLRERNVKVMLMAMIIAWRLWLRLMHLPIICSVH